MDLLVIIGIPKEIKMDEHRVAITPAGVKNLTGAGHEVLVETRAGEGSGFTDEEYMEHGAKIVHEAKEVWSHAEIIVKGERTST